MSMVWVYSSGFWRMIDDRTTSLVLSLSFLVLSYNLALLRRVCRLGDVDLIFFMLTECFGAMQVEGRRIGCWDALGFQRFDLKRTMWGVGGVSSRVVCEFLCVFRFHDAFCKECMRVRHFFNQLCIA